MSFESLIQEIRLLEIEYDDLTRRQRHGLLVDLQHRHALLGRLRERYDRFLELDRLLDAGIVVELRDHFPETLPAPGLRPQPVSRELLPTPLGCAYRDHKPGP